MAERQPVHGEGRLGWFVTTDDSCSLFYCSVQEIGRTAQLRWVFFDTDQKRYIGPSWRPVRFLDEIRDLVYEWRDFKKAIGQDGVDVATLRARIEAMSDVEGSSESSSGLV